MINPEQPLYPIPEDFRILVIGEYKEPGDLRRSKKAKEWAEHPVQYGGGPIVAEENYFFFRRTKPLPPEPLPPKPTPKEIEKALLDAQAIFDFVAMDSWERECVGDSLKEIGEIVDRLKAHQGKTA